MTAREITQVMAGVPREAWEAALEELKADYARDGRGLQLVEVAGGWQITTRPEYNDWVRELLDPQSPTRLSIQALETLAVIAYKQPVTLPEVIELRGVKSGGVLKTLLEKRLIRITGRKPVVGRPMLYGTTKDFLLHFASTTSELPKIEGVRRGARGGRWTSRGSRRPSRRRGPSKSPCRKTQRAQRKQSTQRTRSRQGADRPKGPRRPRDGGTPRTARETLGMRYSLPGGPI